MPKKLVSPKQTLKNSYLDGGRDGTRTRDPELAPSFPVRRLTPAFCAVRALSKLGFGRKPT
jgi:hypothetical protein